MIWFLFMVLFAVVALPVVVTSLRRMRLHSMPGINRWIVAALLPGALFFLFVNSSPREANVLFEMLLYAAGLLLVYLWIREIVHLMGLSDDAFPGRHDKLMWFVLLVGLPPIGVPAFAIFRRAYWASAKPVVDSAARDLI